MVAALRRFVLPGARKADCDQRNNVVVRQSHKNSENDLFAKLGPPNSRPPFEIEKPPEGVHLSLKENKDCSLMDDEQTYHLKKEIQHLRASLRLAHRQLGAARRVGDEWRQFGRYAGQLARQAVVDAAGDCGRRVALLGAEMRQLRRLCLYLDAQRRGGIGISSSGDGGGSTLDENGNIAEFFGDQLKESNNDYDDVDEDAAANRHCACVLSYIDSMEERILRMEREHQQDEEALGIDDVLACFPTHRLGRFATGDGCVITRPIISSHRGSTIADYTSLTTNRNSSASTADSAFSSASTAVGEDEGETEDEETFKSEPVAVDSSTQPPLPDALSSLSRPTSSSPPLLWDDNEHCHQLMGAHKCGDVGGATPHESDYTRQDVAERSDSIFRDARPGVIGHAVGFMSSARLKKIEEQFDRSNADGSFSVESPSTSSLLSVSSSALNDSDLPPKMPQLRISELINTMPTCNLTKSNGYSSTTSNYRHPPRYDEVITTVAATTKRRPIVGSPLVFEKGAEPADCVEQRDCDRGYKASTVWRRMSTSYYCHSPALSEELSTKILAPLHCDYRSATLSPRQSYIHSSQRCPSARMTTTSANHFQQQIRRRVPPTPEESKFRSVQDTFKLSSIGLNRLSEGVSLSLQHARKENITPFDHLIAPKRS